MATRIERKQLKQPDQFVSFWSRVMIALEARRRSIAVAALVAVLAGVGAQVALKSREGRTERATQAFAKLETIANAPVVADDAPPPGELEGPRFKTAAERLDAVLREVDAFLSAHAGSRLVGPALLFKARSLLLAGKPDDAAKIYDELLAGKLDPSLRFAAREGRALADEIAGRVEKAAEGYAALAADADKAGGFYRDRALFARARLLERKGDTKGAETLLREILDKTPATSLKDPINDRLASLEGRGP